MTPELLAQAVGMPAFRARRWLAPYKAAVIHAELSTLERQAAFLAQVGHESGGFVWVREIWGPTPAQRRYEGREDLGNTHPGDGFRYRGRGLIQVTGRANYRAAAKRIPGAPDFEQHPEALERPEWAALSAADYWAAHGLNRYCEPGAVRFKSLTKAINGGLNGYEDRLRRYERARAALQGA